MTFRKATQADAAAIAQMEKRYIECPWSENVVRQTLADELSTIYLLCEGEKVIGYGGLKMVFDTAENTISPYTRSTAEKDAQPRSYKSYWRMRWCTAAKKCFWK